MRYLAFDLGASSGKMVLGAFDGERLSAQPVNSFENGVVQMGEALYWDFPGIYRQLLAGISRAQQLGEFVSLGIDSFNNDFSFVDKRGELLFPVRSYRDQRTVLNEEAIYARMPRRDLYMHSGNQLAPFNTYMQLSAMVLNGQDYLFERADALLMLPDLLTYFLTGQRVMEYTLAAETQMLNLRDKAWVPEVLNAIPFPERLLMPLVLPGTTVGRVTKRLMRDQGMKPFDVVAVCEHDTASAFLALPATGQAKRAIISSGTWAIVGTEVEAPIVNDYGYERNIANEGGFAGHHRLLKNVMGSWIIQELMRDYALHGQALNYAQVRAMALEAEPFACMIDVDDRRFYEPGQMIRKVRAASVELCGRAPETPGSCFRTVQECLALKYRQALEELETLTGRVHDAVHVIGGGSRDEVACQFAANATGRPVTAGPAEGSAIGNILVQMIARGEIASVDEGRQVLAQSQAYRQYLPEDAAAWRARYDEYLTRTKPQK